MSAHTTHSPGFLAIVDAARARIRQIDIAGYQALRGRPHVLVDTREDGEWAAGHAAGAVHIGKGVIERDIEAQVPDKDTTIVLYCGGGFRSALAADALQQMGYRQAISLDGGWKAWTAAGMPVEGADAKEST